MPRTLVLIAEQNIGMAAPRAAWMRGEDALVSTDCASPRPPCSTRSRTADSDSSSTRDRRREGGAGGRDRQRNHQRPGARLKSLTGQRYPVRAGVAISRGEMPDLGPGWRSCAATIAGRAVTRTTATSFRPPRPRRARRRSTTDLRQEAIKKASPRVRAGDDQEDRVALTKDVSAGNDVHVDRPQGAFVPHGLRLPFALTTTCGACATSPSAASLPETQSWM